MSKPTRNPSLFRFFAAGGRRIAAAGTLAVLGVALAGTAVAAPTLSPQLAPRLTGAVTWTATSGNTNHYSSIIEPYQNASQYAARAFMWSERSDAPCWGEVLFVGVSDGTSQRARASSCTEHAASRRAVSRQEPTEVITGIQVCLTEKKSSYKDRLKGVRLWGRTVDPETAALGPINGPSQTVRKHCAKWSSRVNCPSGQVAAKFKMFGISENHEGSKFTGVSLGCRAIEMKADLQPLGGGN